VKDFDDGYKAGATAFLLGILATMIVIAAALVLLAK
jgi:hypothetical protein